MTSKTLSKEKIVSVAVDLLNNQETVTFTKLGKILCIRPQAIYNYFPDVTAVKVAVASYFYDQLAVRLQADLLGLTGKQALKTYANTTVHYSLCKFPISQQILSIPVECLKSPELEKSLSEVYTILERLLNPYIEDDKQRLIFSRMFRSLIVGEVVNVGNQQFDSKLINVHDSFDQSLETVLAIL